MTDDVKRMIASINAGRDSGMIADANAISDNSLTIDADWLTRELVGLNFQPDDVAEDIDECVMHLRLNGVNRRSLVRQIFGDSQAMQHLREIYELQLHRPHGQLDPVAVCAWLPKLSCQFWPSPRTEMHAAVRDAVLRSPEARAVRGGGEAVLGFEILRGLDPFKATEAEGEGEGEGENDPNGNAGEAQEDAPTT